MEFLEAGLLHVWTMHWDNVRFQVEFVRRVRVVRFALSGYQFTTVLEIAFRDAAVLK